MAYRVDIILPVYNEAQNFKVFYDSVSKNVRSDWRMFVVYDFPEDETLNVAGPLAQKDKRIVLVSNRERGVAGAIKSGFKEVETEAVMVTAVDLFEDIIKIDEMVKLLYESRYAIVAPSRYMLGGKRLAGRFLNRTLSRLAGLSLYYLTRMPIHDATNGSKLYRKSFIDSITIESTRGWEVALEITVKAHAAKMPMIEIPIVHSKRKVGGSKFKLIKWLPHYLYWYWFAVKNTWLK